MGSYCPWRASCGQELLSRKLLHFSNLPAPIPGEVGAGGGSCAEGLRACAYLHVLIRNSTADGVSAGRWWDDFAAPVTAQCTVVPFMLYKSTTNLGLACSLSCCLLTGLPFGGGDFYKLNLTSWRGDINRHRGTVEIHSQIQMQRRLFF